MGKGNYYKYKTKKFYEAQGYAVELVEKYRRIINKSTGKVIMIKQDVFGADGISMNKEEIIFWNSKFGKSNLAAGIKEMAKFPYPPFVKRLVVAWETRQKFPNIIDVGDAIGE